MLCNSAFTIAQKGDLFVNPPQGQTTVDRWFTFGDCLSVERGDDGLTITAGPGGCVIAQPLEAEDTVQLRGCLLRVETLPGGIGYVRMTERPERLLPFFDVTMDGGPDWQHITAQIIPETATRVMVVVPVAPNETRTIRRVKLQVDGQFFPVRSYQDELRDCSWFYQHVGTEQLYNTEYGFGITHDDGSGATIGFQLPLSYPLRGRVGHAGLEDVIVDWEAACYGYGGAGATGFGPYYSNTPRMTCHHRHFLHFNIQRDSLAAYETFAWRHWAPNRSDPRANPYIILDAEDRFATA